MKIYDPNWPLVFIHIPKTAGITCREVFGRWYGDNLLLHYYDEANARMPKRYDLDAMHSVHSPVAVFGHFNRSRGFGVEHYYPAAQQFMTILRDPFERAVSTYFFLRKQASAYCDQSRIPQGDLTQYLRGLSPKMTMLNFFPREVTMDNYAEIIETYFVEIGLSEYLHESLQRIARKLGRDFEPAEVPKLNVSERDQEIPYDLKQEFMEERPLDYAVYRYVLRMYE